MKPIEEWKSIPNSIYLISNTGLVKDSLTGILKTQCCIGKRNSAGGFKWKLNE